MKKSILSILFIAVAFIGFAQNPIDKGQAQLNAGVGFSNWGLPVYVGFDYGVHSDITIGAELSYRRYSESYRVNNQTYKYGHSLIGILGNGNYHFNTILGIPDNWDFYAGLNIGFLVWNSPNDYNGSHASGLGLGGQVGGRYYFNKKFGLNLEFAGGNALNGGKFGISIRL